MREVQLDLIPPDMIQSEVNKAVTPDMEGDGIGASVNIVTRQDPPGRRSATLGSGYNALAGREMLLGNVLYGNRFSDGRMGLVLSGSVRRS